MTVILAMPEILSRYQEDCGLKPAPGKQFSKLFFKKPITKKGLVGWLKQ
jgi:hypothetical protein